MTAQIPRILPFGDAAITEAAALIRAGGIVAVPTETVYGLAADATNADAVARIYAAKGRPSFNPLIVHLPDRAAAERIALFDGSARALADRWWPGPLTLVLPLRPDAGIAGLVTAGLDTIALRVPAHRAMQALLRASARPLAAPSANASNAISPTRAEHVAASLGNRVPLILDDGPTTAGLESTIVGFGVGNGAILRPGPITAEQLGLSAAAPSANVTAPGQLATHYAPAKPLRLNATQRDGDEWLIGFGEIAGDDTLSATGDPVEAAARLFDALHRADAVAPPRIAIASVPDSGIGAAINDRLRRAAHR
ncbi:L-threonylcarbamoyladenylate synthase [Sphingomonas sp.]|uniref:L-threonylcarbamoyladenylate synthase n=1 Tax=Sphingomonas sp. TaxID=28214 RepID=UPI00262D4D18|nr:L-threonylcarbamoyladenylate synthase [Sphingomonas sp.]MDF2495812.1 threonylcarbamoyl-AMP synthase [Sphingomonas sp.]